MSRQVNKNETVVDEFSVFEDSCTDKLAGLGPDAFEVTVFFNKEIREDYPVTIGEYGNTGSYWVEWSPDRLGFWEVEVKVLQTKQYWYETYDCLYARDPGDFVNRLYDIRGTVVWNSQRDELVAMAWLNENGQLMKVNGDCEWKFYDSENTLLFSLVSNQAFPTGIYRAKHGNPGLNPEENFYYTCRINDGNGWKESALGLITII